MCDTLVALPDYTQTGSLIFGKNSDREPLEAQSICYVPRTFAQQKTVQCTFIQIPEIAENHAVFLSKPFQMWGAEMGANEYGLVIGNEAVFTNVKIEKKKHRTHRDGSAKTRTPKNQKSQRSFGMYP